jgi:thiol-disulfide isomerase/thioredoxin
MAVLGRRPCPPQAVIRRPVLKRLMSAAILSWLVIGAGSLHAAEVRPFVRGSFKTVMETHKGQPLAVHFWSLTCAPCIAEFPLWAERIRREPGLPVVFVSTDGIEQSAAVAARLKRAGLSAVESHVFADGFTERLLFEVAPDWRGELPRTELIAADGSRLSVTGSLDDAQFAQWRKR